VQCKCSVRLPRQEVDGNSELEGLRGEMDVHRYLDVGGSGFAVL